MPCSTIMSAWRNPPTSSNWQQEKNMKCVIIM
jgi:hypothetical protein